MMSGAGRAVGQPGEIHAFNGENLTQELWSSLMNKSRDDVGSPAKFVIPVVANGRVYVATSINAVQVYGLLPAQFRRKHNRQWEQFGFELQFDNRRYGGLDSLG